MPDAASFDACELNELLERARCGDSVAVGRLLETQRPRLRQMVSQRLDSRLVGRIDPSDVVQDTLMIACERMPEYLRDSTMPFYPWLRNLAWQRLVDLHRQHILAQKRSVSREEPLQIPDDSALRLGSELTVGGTGVLRNLVDAEVVHRVRVALEELASADREIVLMRHVEVRELLPTLRALAQLPKAGRGIRLRPAAETSPGSVGGPQPLVGTLGDFRICRELGRGGMGVVYEAQQQLLGRRVALKVLPFTGMLDSRQLQRFLNEAQAAASLKHPNIVTIFSVGSDRGIHYYAMDYIEGQTLAEVIRQQCEKHGRRSPKEGAEACEPSGQTCGWSSGSEQRSAENSAKSIPTEERSLSQEEVRASAESTHDSQAACWTRAAPRTAEFFRTAARWGVQAAEALEHAHQMGVVHRDIKPSNLLIEREGRLMVTDFGLAQTQAGMQLTMTGDVVGTLRYMSPEQAQGNRRVLDYRTDIYSLGATLYELLTLRPAFESRDRHTLLHQVLEGNPRPLRQIDPAIPRDLETVVLKAMAAEPEARYASAQDLADDLSRFITGQPVRVRRPSLLDRAAHWSRRHRPVVWSALTSLAVIVATLVASIVFVLDAYRGQKELRLAAETSAEQARRNYEEARQAVRQMLTRVADEQVGAIPGMKDVRRRLLEDAVAFYTRLLTLNAADPAVYSDRAEAYMLLAQYQEARSDCGTSSLRRSTTTTRILSSRRSSLARSPPGQPSTASRASCS